MAYVSGVFLQSQEQRKAGMTELALFYYVFIAGPQMYTHNMAAATLNRDSNI